MSQPCVLEDVVLDEDPLELAESLTDVSPIAVTLLCDDEAETGSTVYFGVPLPIGDIAEVKAIISSCEAEDDLFRMQAEVQAIDSALLDQTKTFLARGGDAAEDTASDGVAWGAPLKQRNGTYAALINSPAGLLTAAQVAKIGEIASAGAGLIKLTHAQRVIVLCTAEQIETLKEDLASVDLKIGVLHKGIRNIRGCCGALCRWSGDLDGLGLSIEIDKALFGRPMKFDVKIAVSDCPRNCEEGFCVDIGLIGNGKDAYDLYVGGSAAGRQIRAMRLTTGLTKDDVIPVIEKVLAWYDTHANDNERIYRMFERLGMDKAQRHADAFNAVKDAFVLEEGNDIGEMLLKKLARQHTLLQLRSDLGLSA